MLMLPGTTHELPANAMETRPSSYANAWASMFLTVELYQNIEAIRVSIFRERLRGRWFSIGDESRTRAEYAAKHALPPYGNQRLGTFEFVAKCVLYRGTILNVGRCGPLFDYRGGGLQAEYLDGPDPKVVPMSGQYSDHVRRR